DVGNEAGINLNILLKLGQKVTEVTPATVSRVDTRPYGLIVDALLGIGLTGDVGGIMGRLISLINISNARILSVDIPSGLDATTGRILGDCVRADKTVTFVAKKRGMTIKSGARVCGTIVVADLGVPL
ncbi:MAG: NAD(P)H-hydrate epimerase, partial [Candidatus Omnitrophota bacterium]